jgi:hypothetical protein
MCHCRCQHGFSCRSRHRKPPHRSKDRISCETRSRYRVLLAQLCEVTKEPPGSACFFTHWNNQFLKSDRPFLIPAPWLIVIHPRFRELDLSLISQGRLSVESLGSKRAFTGGTMRKLISALSAVLVSIGTLVPVEMASAAPMTIQQPVEISKAAPNANVQTVHYRDRWHRHHRRWDRRHYGWERRHHRRWDRRYYGERYYGERRYYRPYYGDRPYRRSGIYLQF